MIKPVIIVCAYNEQDKIQCLLQALMAQTYGEFSVFLIDDGSTDSTSAICRQFIDEHSLHHFHLIKKEHSGKEVSMREAILSVNDENALILTTDADCQPSATWVECMAGVYEDSEAAMLIGPVAIDTRHPFQATEFLSIEAVTLGSAAIGCPLMCGGANLGFTRKAYIRAMEYMTHDFDNGGDMYFLEAVKRLGLTVSAVVSNDAMVVTRGADSIKGFIRQRTRWAGKAANYTDRGIITAGFVTATVQIVMSVSLILAFAYPKSLYVWLVKIIADFIILGATALIQKRARLIPYILPVSLVYPFYVTATLFISLIRK